MAGDWIPMRIDLRDDPAVIAIATATNLDEDTVAGKLLRLWGWANRQLTNGCAPSVTDSWIDRFLSAPGFAAAMLSAGWLVTRAGQLHFPKFDRWNSQGAKQRVLASQRMRRMRCAEGDGDSVTKAQPQNRTEQKSKRTKPSPGSPAKVPKPRPRDELFDAIASITGSDPKSSGSFIGGAKKLLLLAEPPYTPAEVLDFGSRIAELCPWTEGRRPTLGEVEKYIGLVRSGQGEHNPRKSNFETQDERNMRRTREVMGRINDEQQSHQAIE